MLGIAAIAYVIGAVIIFLVGYKLFVTLPWSAGAYVILFCYIALCIALFIGIALNYFYVVENKGIVVKRLGKSLLYKYSEIIYIDEEESKKTKMVTFVMKNGDVRYLTYDKEGKLLDIMLKNCKNLISKEELKEKFPRVKL